MTNEIDWQHTDDELPGREEFSEDDLVSQGFQQYVGEEMRWDHSEDLPLPAPTLNKDANSASLTWDVPLVDHIRGHGHFFAHGSNGAKTRLTIWDDGRVNWYLSWRSSRRHGGDQTVDMNMRFIWRYRDSHHIVKQLPKLGMGKSYNDKPQGRYELLPWLARVQMSKSLFQLYTHPNIYGVARAYVRHK